MSDETSPQQPKRIDIKHFREEGYLQEANRLFFHPLGLALEVTVSDDDHQIYHMRGIGPNGKPISGYLIVPKEIVLDLEDIEELKMTPIPEMLGGVWDYRDDPEGMIFGEGVLDAEKALAVQRQRDSKVEERTKLMGSSIQPLPES